MDLKVNKKGGWSDLEIYKWGWGGVPRNSFAHLCLNLHDIKQILQGKEGSNTQNPPPWIHNCFKGILSSIADTTETNKTCQSNDILLWFQ